MKKKLKKSLNLISLQNDVLDENEMDGLFGGRNCSLDCNHTDDDDHFHQFYDVDDNTWSTW